MKSKIKDSDLSHIWQHAEQCLQELDGARLFITGGTGFFGCWLLESLRFAKENFGLCLDIVVLTRNPEVFSKKMPHLALMPGLSLITGDVTDFRYPSGVFTHVIHAATDAQTMHQANPAALLKTIVDGTCHTLEFAHRARVKKFLLISSGAVYGVQPPTLSHIDETYPGAPDSLNPMSCYGLGKRMAEYHSVLCAKTYEFEIKIARCFAFVGPYLPVDAHFAIGNFIQDMMLNQDIHILGDGSTHRSYLYAADLVIWLWTIMCKGPSGIAYNVGSEEDIDLFDLAHLMSKVEGAQRVVTVAKMKTGGALPARYVPSTALAKRDLQLKQYVTLPDAIRRTLDWHLQCAE